jgi:drug/metabolite transporter (DMT)-like permease
LSASVFAIVLAAAFLHALWNAIVKGAADRAVMLGLIALGHVVPGAVVMWQVGLPNMASTPYILASTVIHWVYYWLLFIAYRSADLSVVYPIARGVAPVLIAVGAWAWIGEALPLLTWAGVLTVSAGIMVLSSGVLRRTVPANGVLAALATGCMIASYSLVDGIGVRLSGNTLAYVGGLFVAELCVPLFLFPGRLDRIRSLPRRVLVTGFAGGVISGTAYAMVLYAKTLAPLGVVSALRETSVIFAALIGVWWFSEGPKPVRLIAAAVVGCGILLIGMSQ